MIIQVNVNEKAVSLWSVAQVLLFCAYGQRKHSRIRQVTADQLTKLKMFLANPHNFCTVKGRARDTNKTMMWTARSTYKKETA